MTTAYGSITVSGLTDIADIYFEYALAVDSANVTNSYPFNQTGELGWTVNGESRKIPPTWTSGYKVWVREVKVKTDIVTKIYGNPYPDTAINQTNIDLVALQTRVKKIWSNSSGSYMASGIGSNEVDTATVSTYGFNSRTTTGGISFNYNAIPLTELGTSGLKLYIPTISNNIVTSSNLGVELTTSALKFYDPTYHKAAMVLTGSSLTFNKPNTTTPAATLNSTGLNIAEGSITLGSNFAVNPSGSLTAKSGTIGGITIGASYLTTNSSRTTYTATTSGLTLTTDGIGAGNGSANTFYVQASTGKLYASNAEITGIIKANSGYIGGWRIGTDGNKTLHNGNTDTSPVPGEGVIILSKGIVNPPATGLLPENKTWAFTAGNNFGVTTDGILYTNGANITNINGANITASTITIGSFSENTQANVLNSNVPLNDYTLKADFNELDTYVNSHMIIDGNELSILSNDTAAKVTLGLNGLSIYGLDGIAAQYGTDAVIGNPNKFHIRMTPNYNNTGEGRLSFYRGPNTDSNNEVAYISGNKLYITQSVVLQQMDIGTSVRESGLGQWSWKVHEVNGQNNLYLKWYG